MNLLKLAGALGLSLLAAAASAQAASSQNSAATLSGSAGGSELFSRSADGSVERADLPDSAFAEGSPSGPAASGLLSGRAEGRAAVQAPPTPLVAREPRDETPLRSNPFLAVGTLGAGLFLAIGALLLQHSGPAALETSAAAPVAYASDPVIAALAARGARAPAPAAAVAAEPTPAAAARLALAPRPAARLSDPFVDARMPVGTWRAISRQEQALIESWDRSPEKARGLASLEQWLDRHPAAGVDVAGLKTKLQRV